MHLSLASQEPIITKEGAYKVDFLVSKRHQGQIVARIAVELGGHEYYEKTRDQFMRDKKRERAIERSGLTVFRFSGSEICRNPRRCIEEVVDELP